MNSLPSSDNLSTGICALSKMPHPSPEEKRKRKKKQLVQSLDSYFMARKYPGYYEITNIFSHAQMVVCMLTLPTVLCQTTGGKVTEGCSFRQKQH
ncbi:40S ribosomal protein S27-like [Hyaena hyaena]|uniref:40S ribosomal protein S27-like n=1 Tax=Hyaena hyaena TaxID=95912 RepID=UPI0019242A0E|nr:40S ribosomal protein S27-like [Hyaena hyaena]